MAQKPNETGAFWQSVVGHTSTVAPEKEISLEPHFSPHFEDRPHDPLLEHYQKLIAHERSLWLSVPTKSGRPKKGPRWIAVVRCTVEGRDEQGNLPYGVTGSNTPLPNRWRCKTCKGMTEPVWIDGPGPDKEEAAAQWAKAEADRASKRKGKR